MRPNYHRGDKVIFTGWPADVYRDNMYACEMPETDACYCSGFDSMIGCEFTIAKASLCPATCGCITRDHYRYYFEDAPENCAGCYFVEEWFQFADSLPAVTVEELI